MEIALCSHPDSDQRIVTKFCTWHDSCAVVACARICCNLMASNWIIGRQTLHQIWIVCNKSFVKCIRLFGFIQYNQNKQSKVNSCAHLRFIHLVDRFTVETLYNTINFCWSTHKRHSITRPKGRGMGCLLWVQRATYCVDLSILNSIKYLPW